MRMKEIIKGFPKTDNEPFSIVICGISYCDGSYYINRPGSRIHCFEYIMKGTGTVVTTKGLLHPQEGDVYFLRTGEDHLYYSDAYDPWIKIWFNVRGSLVDSLVNAYGVGDIHLFRNCDAKQLFEKFYENAETMSDRQEIEQKNAVILHEIVQKMAECVRCNDEKYRSDAALLRKYIDENCEKPLKIDTLCELIYRSRSQTIRIFKNSFGITPYEYILSRKMQVAKRMLRDTRMPVREISSTLGFSNEHYFSARFKTYNGITPGQYRKNSSI